MNTTSLTSTNPNVEPTNRLMLRWVKFWYWLSYSCLALAVALTLLNPAMAWTTKELALGLSLVWGAWYWIFVVKLHRWLKRDWIQALTFFLAVLLSGYLSRIYQPYMMLLFGFYGLSFGVLRLRWAVSVVVLVSVTAIWVFTGFQPGWQRETGLLVAFTMAGIFDIVLGFWINTIIRLNRERLRMIEDLEAAHSELSKAERQAGVVQERQRLAGEIHDTLAQGFTSIVLHLEAADEALESDAGAARQHLDRARQTARDNLAEARRLVWALRPEVLGSQPFAQALERVVRRWSQENNTPAGVEITGVQQPLSSPLEVVLLRAAQEALENVRKHARAAQVNLTLSYMEDQVSLDVHDDGVGFDTASLPTGQVASDQSGFGLRGMRERIKALGGQVIVESAPGEGTTLVIVLPISENSAQPLSKEGA